MSFHVKDFFDKKTGTFTYVIADLATKDAAVIDSVLNFDLYSGHIKTLSADEVVAYIEEQGFSLQWILETHVHADHLTAAAYIQKRLGGKIAIASRVKEVLKTWLPLFELATPSLLAGEQFDYLFTDNEIFQLGRYPVHVLPTPGHTPACASYCVEHSIFVGDTLLMPDLGTTRTDFPGGSAAMLYDSIQRILSLAPETKIFLCHDYPPTTRGLSFSSTVQEEKENNIMIHKGILKEDYVRMRQMRDQGKTVPELLLPALQVNLQAGQFGKKAANDHYYLKIPIDAL